MITPFRLGWPAVTSVARTSIAATVSFLIARVASLPEAYWAAIMTLVIMQSTLGATVQLSRERFIGTVMGAIAGGVLAGYYPMAWWVFAGGLFVLGILCAALRLQNSYRFAGITLAIVVLIPHTASPWIVALHRFIEVSIGTVVGLAITWLWPEPLPAQADG